MQQMKILSHAPLPTSSLKDKETSDVHGHITNSNDINSTTTTFSTSPGVTQSVLEVQLQLPFDRRDISHDTGDSAELDKNVVDTEINGRIEQKNSSEHIKRNHTASEHIKRNHTASEHIKRNHTASNGFSSAIRNVHLSHTMNGREYNIINRWGFIVNVLLNAAFYGTLYVLCVNNTEYYTPVNEKRLALIAILVGGIVLIAQIVSTVGYCLTCYSHPLVRSRGIEYLITVFATTFVPAVLCLVIGLYDIAIIDIHSIPIANTLYCVRLGFMLVFLGAQVARQRLIYILFVHDTFVNPSRNEYRMAYGIVVIWAILCLIPVGIMYNIDLYKFAVYVDICGCIGFQVILFALLYYSWLTRNVSQAFSDWESNVLAGIVIWIVPVLTVVLRHTYFDVSQPTIQNPPDVRALFLPTFFSYFALSVVTVQLFGMIAAIVFFRISTAAELDPSSLFANAWGTSNFGDGKTTFASGTIETRVSTHTEITSVRTSQSTPYVKSH